MKRQAFKTLIVAFSCCGLLCGQIAQAATRIGDVALQPGGLLHGQVLNEQGVAQPNARVTVVRDGEAIAVANTDERGRFVVSGLSGGVHEIHTNSRGDVYRLWAPRTAPPAAKNAVLIVTGDNVVRSVGGGPPVAPAAPASSGWMKGLGWLANPWVLAAIVAAAIAIPLAVDDAS